MDLSVWIRRQFRHKSLGQFLRTHWICRRKLWMVWKALLNYFWCLFDGIIGVMGSLCEVSRSYSWWKAQKLLPSLCSVPFLDSRRKWYEVDRSVRKHEILSVRKRIQRYDALKIEVESDVLDELCFSSRWVSSWTRHRADRQEAHR